MAVKSYLFKESPFGGGGFEGFNQQGGPGGQGGPDGKGFPNFWEEVQDFFTDGTNSKKGDKQQRNRKGKDVNVNR